MKLAFDHVIGVLLPGLGWNQLAPHVSSPLIVHNCRNVLFCLRTCCSIKCCVWFDSQWLILPCQSRVDLLDFTTDGGSCQRLYSICRFLLLFESCHFSFFAVFEHLVIGSHASRRVVTTLALVAFLVALDGRSPPSHLVFHAQRAAAMRDGLDTPGALGVLNAFLWLLRLVIR